MAARDIGGETGQGEIGPTIKKSMSLLLPEPEGAGKPGAGYDEHAMAEMGLAKKSIDYTMALASASLGIMFMVLLLQGFSINEFYIDTAVLTALMPSLSVAAALKVFSGVSGRAKGGK